MKKNLLTLVLLSTFALPVKCIKSIESTLPELIVIDSTIIETLGSVIDNLNDSTCFEGGRMIKVRFGPGDNIPDSIKAKYRFADIYLFFSSELSDSSSDDSPYYGCFWLTTTLGTRLCVIEKTLELKPDKFNFSGEKIEVGHYFNNSDYYLDGDHELYIWIDKDSISVRSNCWP